MKSGAKGEFVQVGIWVGDIRSPDSLSIELEKVYTLLNLADDLYEPRVVMELESSPIEDLIEPFPFSDWFLAAALSDATRMGIRTATAAVSIYLKREHCVGHASSGESAFHHVGIYTLLQGVSLE